jgi:hypothetical protein
MPEPIVDRRDVESALEARRELGPDYERHVVDSLVRQIEQRLDERLRERRPRERERHPIPILLPLGSLGIGIGATGAALGPTHGGSGVVVAIIAWIAIAIVNVAYALRR